MVEGSGRVDKCYIYFDFWEEEENIVSFGCCFGGSVEEVHEAALEEVVG